MRIPRTVLLPLVLLGGAAAALVLRGQARPAPAHPAPPPASASLRAEGRVATFPGGEVQVGTDLGGTLVSMSVKDGDAVRKGQVLARLDARTDQAALLEARARVKELEADATFQAQEARRQESLASQGIASAQSRDQLRNQSALATARLEAARATVRRLEVTCAKHEILAPISGQVLTRLAQPGETVAPGAALLRLATTDHTRIEAEIDEFDLSRVREGMPVVVRAEGQSATWRGRVAEIPRHVEGRRLKPQDPARPTDTRVLLVKVELQEMAPLKLGQRVELELLP